MSEACMSVAELMADDSKNASMVVREAKRASFWNGVLDGFGGPVLLGMKQQDVRHHPVVKRFYRNLRHEAFQKAQHPVSAPQFDREYIAALAEALMKIEQSSTVWGEEQRKALADFKADIDKKQHRSLVRERNERS